MALVAPNGRLRVAINFANTMLTRRGTTLEESGGVAVEMARELARRLGVPLDIVPYDGAGAITAAAASGAYDVAFLAIDPQRAGALRFSPPYVLIEGGAMVHDDSPLANAGEIDRPGLRITVGAGSAYDLFLSRTIEKAELVRAPTSAEAVEMFVRERLDVSAGVKTPLAEYAAHHTGLRVLGGCFMEIAQAMATVHGADAQRFITQFVEDLKASGFVARALAANAQTDAVVPP